MVVKAALVVMALVAGVALVLTLTGRWSLSTGGPHAAHDEDIEDFEERLMREIRGVDRNHDGVRDDVEAWILDRFEDDAAGRQAFLQLAADYQRVLLTTGDPQASHSSLLELAGSLSCVRYVMKSDAEARIAQLKAVVLDSDIRVRVWLKAHDRLQKAGIGAESMIPSASSCGLAW